MVSSADGDESPCSVTTGDRALSIRQSNTRGILSMNRTLLSCVTLAGLASMFPTDAVAQYCQSPSPINCTLSQTRPVVTTQLRPQQVTTFCDVTETQVQHKQVVENVPVTTCKNVTVDEGGYQMVWVPKPVTRQISSIVFTKSFFRVAAKLSLPISSPQTQYP